MHIPLIPFSVNNASPCSDLRVFPLTSFRLALHFTRIPASPHMLFASVFNGQSAGAGLITLCPKDLSSLYPLSFPPSFGLAAPPHAIRTREAVYSLSSEKIL